MGIFGRLRSAKARDYIFRQIGAQGAKIENGKQYVSVTLLSFRIDEVRKWFNKYFGGVHSFCRLNHVGSENGKAEYRQLVKPTNLAGIDKDTADQVIVLRKTLLDQVPYNGGLEVEAGLFSIKSSSMATGLIDIIGDVSDTAGVAFLKTAAPFLPIIEKAANFFLGADKDADLEIGIDAGFPLSGDELHAGRYALVRAEADKLDPQSLSVDDQTLKLLSDGAPVLNFPYMVFEIRGSGVRENWAESKDLRESHAAIAAAVKDGRLDDAREKVTAFKYIAFSSYDLLPDDADRLVRNALDRLNRIDRAGGISAKQTLRFGELEELDPFVDMKQ